MRSSAPPRPEGRRRAPGELPADQRIAFRIGINIGDIIIEDDDIYGDGVNIAARLEALAEPGGICVARNVYNQVKNKVEFGFAPMGEHKVKNIPEPVVGLPGADRPRPARQDARPRSGRARRGGAGRRSRRLLALLAAEASQPGCSRGGTRPRRLTAEAPPLPDRPSIAVLPFENLSDDAEEEYFADGLTDDLITDLSKISGLFVIARNSAFDLQGQARQRPAGRRRSWACATCSRAASVARATRCGSMRS